MVLLVVPALSRLADRPGWRRARGEQASAPRAAALPVDREPHGQRLAGVPHPCRRRPEGLLSRAGLGAAPLRAKSVDRAPHLAAAHGPGRVARRGDGGAASLDTGGADRPGRWAASQRGGAGPGRSVRDAACRSRSPSTWWSARCCGTPACPTYVVATLLVTLALYSVYPWSLIGTTLSWRVAAVAGAAVMVLGVAAGGVAGLASRWQDLRTIHRAANVLSTLPAPGPQPLLLPPGQRAAELRGSRTPLASRDARGGRGQPRAVGRCRSSSPAPAPAPSRSIASKGCRSDWTVCRCLARTS